MVTGCKVDLVYMVRLHTTTVKRISQETRRIRVNPLALISHLLGTGLSSKSRQRMQSARQSARSQSRLLDGLIRVYRSAVCRCHIKMSPS